MEQPNKDKRQTGQSVAFYAALAVCLIAVGVGTWQLLRTEERGQEVSAVSSAVALPGEADPPPEPATEDVPAIKAESPDPGTPDASASGESKDASDKNKTATTDSKAASDKKTASTDSKAASDKKTASTDSKAASDKKTASTDSKAASDKKTASTDNKTASGKKSASNGKKAASDGSKGTMARPVEGNTVTGFSMDKLLYNETMRDWRTHDGLDIAADAGTAVAAAKDGTVESVTADPIMGTTVVIRHEGPWESVYASLTDAPEVEAGDEVTAGQVIGYVGETAASESALGPHLHFTVLNDGKPVDPETLFP
ncbi:MAG: peptidoglycan DD-metalloendopeptidase family protein [Oscillibacter sp.]|nr:peptidoglycan DD-metalloendopeptidase family protein [Oscillibacter sp.]